MYDKGRIISLFPYNKNKNGDRNSLSAMGEHLGLKMGIEGGVYFSFVDLLRDNHRNRITPKVIDNVSLKKVVAQLIKDNISASGELQDALTDKNKWEDEVRELKEKNSALLREKGKRGPFY
ncbi:hypothetical protein LOD99_14481 [Oopsacas minuta]|uniref:Uncharacterized protein n=1 Tax=Oopsacas minuta TaxID=111878 RepID=A0AAV7KFB3_9METZ|nr:hypothetical protein LOD99_14481 [Oopsacas minuta]